MFVLGRMRWVAGKTSLLVGHGRMLERDLPTLLFMAIHAEIIRSFLFEFWVLGSMRRVTGQTFPFLKGVVLYRAAGFEL